MSGQRKTVGRKPVLDYEVFIDSILAGKGPESAYWAAGGKTKDMAEASRQGKQLMKKLKGDIEDALIAKQPQHLAGMLNLLPLATETYREVLQNEKASTRDKLAAAKAVQDYASALLPKKTEVNTTQTLEIGDNLDDLIQELLSQQGSTVSGAIESIIEGEIIEESGTCSSDQAESGEGKAE